MIHLAVQSWLNWCLIHHIDQVQKFGNLEPQENCPCSFSQQNYLFKQNNKTYKNKTKICLLNEDCISNNNRCLFQTQYEGETTKMPSQLRCFKIFARILKFIRRPNQLHSLKFSVDTLYIEKNKHGCSKKISFSRFSRRNKYDKKFSMWQTDIRISAVSPWNTFLNTESVFCCFVSITDSLFFPLFLCKWSYTPVGGDGFFGI